MDLARWRLELLFFLPLYTAGYYLWIWWWQGNDDVRALGNIGWSALGPLLALVCLWITFRRLRGPGRFFWLFVLLAVVSYLLADVVWLLYVAFGTTKVPFPSWTDPFYMLYYLFLLAAMCYRMYERKNSARMVRLLFDTLIVMTVATSLSWEFLIQPLLYQQGVSTFAVLVSVTYPMLDLGVLFGVVSLYFSSRSSFTPWALFLMMSGLLLFVCGDSAYLYQQTLGTYLAGSWFDPLWSVGLLLLGLSGMYVTEEKTALSDDRPLPRDTVRLILPYAALIVLFAVMVLRVGHLDAIVVGSALAMTLVIVRQILTMVENDRLLRKLHHLNEELESKVQQRTHELSVKNAELTVALQVKDDFMAAISHELRTPMHGILGYVELIENEEDGPISDELRADLQVIRRSANRLLRLIEDILNFSKIENGKEQVKLEDVEIDELLHQIQEELKLFADEKKIAFVLHLPDPIGTVRTDSIKVEQVLINLVNNAIKFTDHGHVMISARRRHGLLELMVEDTGIGIERGHYDYIFEPFTQVDGGTTRKYNGTGLGLAIVRKLVGLMHGAVTLESEPGKGSRFVVRIPIGD
ncbi:DUF4084 domain-containing protein [Tumebacillus sp. ITR2]|uniref:histidine kinase n=1 Tax=Tumebacillus amylolyticus TaxID=2801339 RepID=A0ABS1J6F8_9BACL|nr:DUF4084 domain-containing protein [Tumebacillus amylolyticus]MBL0385872.1 DUF4084 domain-containing protein [Tumebacillus amylolyticus]